ncbi:hypothetical protein EXIGLDRAFT_761072 [Exidia glandulosa HHB12029]|uniref:Extracellular membrane protein CFEM domain-containing protein n=1 Tax=Exidia glandulosa HHB12029 TaxID=1314781 RepID=A0A165NQ49_EXIGL|nr:hypothetical protein EXIGLDRAFT_761072 [Exidia glandulosa HHB12029]
MRFSVLLVAAAATLVSAQTSSSLNNLFGRATDTSACASDCGAQSAAANLDAATKCTTDSGGDSTKLQICVCQSPALVQGVNDCMQKECPDDAHFFQDGCDIITGKTSTTGSDPASTPSDSASTPSDSASTPTDSDSASTPTASGTGSAGSLGVSAGVALSSVLFAGVALL